MLYLVKFRAQSDAQDLNFRVARTLFAECNTQPSREKVLQLLNRITGGDFLEDTIEIRELRDFDPIEVRGRATVFSL